MIILCSGYFNVIVARVDAPIQTEAYSYLAVTISAIKSLLSATAVEACTLDYSAH